ncbi:proactivator polypeptide-like 1 [Phalaenopsis equestris]|uniref:proactivator polypeptide-like 1 n=1 Tax=Phalaenopsis equestris TaxID=78828 RepID=UPI0009E43F62|nr:proactivator polypeptide-like 1 [Phalaenopsis equestris]
MVSKVAFVLLIVVIIGCIGYNDAKNIEHLNILDANAVITRNEHFCELCQDFTTRILSFFKENGTTIVETLHQVCSHLYSFEEQCNLLVDHYTSIFFAEIAKLQPEKFCKKVNLCENKALAYIVQNSDTCTVCHNFVNEVVTKLDDPETQLKIMQILLKECNQTGDFSHQCKRLVIEYGPIILLNAEKFFEKTDVCAAIHACNPPQIAAI